MTGQDTRSVTLAIALAALAGYVDALGFLSFGNFFVSFMSGNSTRLGIRLAAGELGYAYLTFGVIGLFVLGVVIGSLLGSRMKPHETIVLLTVGTLLMTAALFHQAGLARFGIASMLLAMGAENAVFQRNGETVVGLTYMTGTLVKLGQGIARTLQGEKNFSWLRYLLLWLGLVGGATVGATAYFRIGLNGLWLGAFTAILLAVIFRNTLRGEDGRHSVLLN